ncbi:hypothetical protein [Mesorhizobium sp. CAU 1741]|uniref:hypothetical protein n=1 Tax=Mesorhizobium sp. CAU 1741 TaxID=3140366 RepID=UPI00325AA370
MRNTYRHLQVLATSALLASISSSLAHAQDAQAAVDRLKQIVEEQGAVIVWDRVDVSGDSAVLVNTAIGSADERMPFGDITLNGISRVENGFRVEEMVTEPFSIGDETGSVQVEDTVVSGLLLPDEGNIDDFGGSVFYESASVSNVSVTVEDTEIASLTNFWTEMTAPEDGEPMDYSGGAEQFYIDLSMIEDPNQKAVLQALEYEELFGAFDFAGYWQPTDGRFALTEYNMSVEDAGTLGIMLDIGGYTPSFITSLRDLQMQMAANPDGDSSAQGLAVLGLMQQLSFHSAEISFTDDSLTSKVLEFVASSQGMSASDVANQAKAVLPFMLGQLGNPELTMQATQAVTAYLDDPQVLRIKAAPPGPVAFALIMAGAMSAPAELTKTLGVSVSAND